MAGPHLERLRAQKSQKRVVEAHSKPSKPGFEGFEGDQCRRFLENRRLVEGDDATRKNSKNVTPAYPQNLQNLNSPSAPARPQSSAPRSRSSSCRRRCGAGRCSAFRPPALVPVERWRPCVRGGSRLLAKWAEQAEALGWTSADLFGLHQPPERRHPSYSRLSRYDRTGLAWLLQGREVVAL